MLDSKGYTRYTVSVDGQGMSTSSWRGTEAEAEDMAKIYREINPKSQIEVTVASFPHTRESRKAWKLGLR